MTARPSDSVLGRVAPLAAPFPPGHGRRAVRLPRRWARTREGGVCCTHCSLTSPTLGTTRCHQLPLRWLRAAPSLGVQGKARAAAAPSRAQRRPRGIACSPLADLGCPGLSLCHLAQLTRDSVIPGNALKDWTSEREGTQRPRNPGKAAADGAGQRDGHPPAPTARPSVRQAETRGRILVSTQWVLLPPLCRRGR